LAGLCGFDAMQHHGRAGVSKAIGDGPANALSGACHQGTMIFQHDQISF
jgi:hypothetical protein